MDLKKADLGRERVVGKDQITPKILEIKAAHFNWLKLAIAGIIAVVIALAVSLMQLHTQHRLQQEENARLLTKVNELQGEVAEEANQLNMVTSASDSNKTKALGYIQGIQQKLQKINEYLSRRGLKGMSFKPVKNEKVANKMTNLQLYSKYNHYLEQLVSNVAMIPMGYPRISAFTSFFGYRGNPFDFGRNEFHPGLDFRGHMGDQVKCTASGRVIFTGRAGGYGNCIRIQHAGNLQTWYGHLSHINVREGQQVSVGEIIGRVGSTGRSTGPHLHYEVRKNGKPVNPVQYLTLNS